MTMTLYLALFSAATAIFTAGVTYLLSKRKTSGKINTSEAESLWAEAQSMRDDYRGRLLAAEVRIGVLEAQLVLVAAERDKLVDALVTANKKAAEVAVETAKLAAAVAIATAQKVKETGEA